MKKILNLTISSLFLFSLISCNESKTVSQELSNELTERNQILNESLDYSLINNDVFASELYRNPSLISFEEIHQNYISVIDGNANHEGLENYKRFYLNAIMRNYNLENHENPEIIEFYLNEHYTLINFKDPLSEFKLIKSLKGKIVLSNFTQYLSQTSQRIMSSLDDFYNLKQNASIKKSEEEIQKINVAIDEFNNLLLNLNRMKI